MPVKGEAVDGTMKCIQLREAQERDPKAEKIPYLQMDTMILWAGVEVGL